MRDPNIRWRFVGYGQGLPIYEIVDEEKEPLRYTNEPVLGTKGDKHDERE